MSTESYKNVLRRLELTGREYFDGFASADFADLSGAELQEVRSVLVSRARSGDGVSLEALKFVLSAQEAASIVDELLSARTGSELFDAQLAAMLYEIRQDDDSWSRMMRVLESGNASARRWIINKLSAAELAGPRSNYLTQRLRVRIPQETDHVALLGQAALLLRLLGFKPASADMAASAMRLQSADRRERVKELERIAPLR